MRADKERLAMAMVILLIIVIFWGAIWSLAKKIVVKNKYFYVYIPVEVEIDGNVYTMDDLETLSRYHGTSSYTLKADKKDVGNNEVYFYREGKKCNLVTKGSLSYLEKTKQKE